MLPSTLPAGGDHTTTPHYPSAGGWRHQVPTCLLPFTCYQSAPWCPQGPKKCTFWATPGEDGCRLLHHELADVAVNFGL